MGSDNDQVVINFSPDPTGLSFWALDGLSYKKDKTCLFELGEKPTGLQESWAWALSGFKLMLCRLSFWPGATGLDLGPFQL